MPTTTTRPAVVRKRLRKQISATKRELRTLQSQLVRAGREPRDLDPHQQAGKKNIALMSGVFAKGRTLTAAEATRRAGSKPGHQVWAIRALLVDGVIEETGAKIAGKRGGLSKQYRYVAAANRSTRLGPGE